MRAVYVGQADHDLSVVFKIAIGYSCFVFVVRSAFTVADELLVRRTSTLAFVIPAI